MNHRHQGEQAFVDSARKALQHSCERLDGPTLSRLTRMRHQALERGGRRRMSLLAPFGGLVTACVLALVIVLDEDPVPSPAPIDAAVPAEDIEILTSGDLEFYEELEFYQWLAENGTAV